MKAIFSYPTNEPDCHPELALPSEGPLSLSVGSTRWCVEKNEIRGSFALKNRPQSL